MIYTSFYNSTIGKIILTSDGENLTGLYFEGQKNFPNLINATNNNNLQIFTDTKILLDRYFQGKEILIENIKLKPNGTDFQLRIWKELLKIPYGTTISYSEIAKNIGINSSRAIGNAVSKNPISIIIPCHRVIGKNGNLTGYAGGLDRKIQLLKIEKCL